MVAERPSPDRVAMAQTACARASLYGLLAGVFGRLPDHGLVNVFKSTELQSLLDGLGELGPKISAGVVYVKSYRDSMGLRPDAEVLTELSVDRTRILRASGHAGLKPPYESAYTHGKDGGASLLAVKGFYRQAGLLPDETIQERPDFLCLELDFMKNLCQREQQEWASGADTAVTITHEEQFLREHLGNWLGEFCMEAQKRTRTDFYRGFLVILDGVVGIETEYARSLTQMGQTAKPQA